MNDNATQITLILDRSGSMGAIMDATVEGVNAFLAEQQKAAGEALLYFVQFDDQYDHVYDGDMQGAPLLTLAEKPDKNHHRYEPRGITALLDAIGRTIEDLGKRLEKMPEPERPAKVVVVIMTDGLENASKHYKLRQIADMIAHQRDVYKWQFQYLGANQDAITEAGKFGIPASHANTFRASTMGTRNAVRAMSSNISSFRETGDVAAMNYSPEARAAAMEEDEPVPHPSH